MRSLNPHLEEEFTDDDVIAGFTLHDIPLIDPTDYPKSFDPEHLVPFWLAEVERWQAEYYRLTEEVYAVNPFRDQSVVAAMREELAYIAANVIEASRALTLALRMLDTVSKAA